jgi:hypothetical protein
MAAGVGAIIGAWDRILLLSFSYPSSIPVNPHYMPLRIFVGISVLAIWKLYAKSLIRDVLVFAYLRLGLPLESKRSRGITKWTPEMMSKYTVYLGIGAIAVDWIPRLFYVMGI